MSDSKQIRVSTLITAAAVTLALSAVIALVSVRIGRANTAELKSERGWNATPADTASMRAAQLERLSRYAWIDRQKNVTAVPIERAMSLVVEESASSRGGAPR